MSIRIRAAFLVAAALLVSPVVARAQAAAKPKATASIATILGKPVTRADLGAAPRAITQIAAGDAAKQKSLEAKWEAQALTGLVLGTLLDLYATEQKVEATPHELSELLSMSVAGAQTPEAIRAGATPPDTNDARYRLAGAGVVVRFKINAALYKEYGGDVIVDPQAGPMPMGSYRRFLEARQKAGAFTVAAAWKERFWSSFAVDAQQPIVPPAEAAGMMSRPWWRGDGK